MIVENVSYLGETRDKNPHWRFTLTLNDGNKVVGLRYYGSDGDIKAPQVRVGERYISQAELTPATKREAKLLMEQWREQQERAEQGKDAQTEKRERDYLVDPWEKDVRKIPIEKLRIMKHFVEKAREAKLL